MFLKEVKDPTSKQFDDDEWIRSLTEAQEITADVPEGSVMYDQQEADPKKVRPIQMGESCGSMSHDDFGHSAKENDRVESSVRSGVWVSSQAHCGGGVERSKHVPR